MGAPAPGRRRAVARDRCRVRRSCQRIEPVDTNVTRQRALPGGLLSGEVGFEFAAIFRDSADAELRIVPGYSPYVGGEAIDTLGDDYSRFARRPITIPALSDGRYDSTGPKTQGKCRLLLQ